MDCAEESTLYTQNPPAVQRRSSRALPSRPPARQFQTTPIYDTRAMADEAVQAPETRRLAKGPQSPSPYQPSRRPRTLSGFIQPLRRHDSFRFATDHVSYVSPRRVSKSHAVSFGFTTTLTLSHSLCCLCVPLLSEDHPPLRVSLFSPLCLCFPL
jgi:hypothetical protein